MGGAETEVGGAWAEVGGTGTEVGGAGTEVDRACLMSGGGAWETERVVGFIGKKIL